MKSTRHLLSLFTGMTLLSAAHAERPAYRPWQTNSDDGNPGITFRAVAVQMGSNGRVFTTGYRDDLVNDSWLTVCTDSMTGAELWRTTLSASSDCRPTALVVDGDNNITVGGFSTGSNMRDFRVVKYKGDDGTVIWDRSFNGPANGNDEVTAMAVDGSGNICVTGTSMGNGTNEDFLTIKIGKSSGNSMWSKRHSTSSVDRPLAIAVNNADVIVTGRSVSSGKTCFCTVLYDALGDDVWVRYAAYGADDVATAVCKDRSYSGYVVAGMSKIVNTPDYEVRVIFYYSDGSLGWTKNFPAPGGNLGSRQWWPKVASTSSWIALGATMKLDGFRTVSRVTLLDPYNGASGWSNQTTAPAGSPANTFVEDYLIDMKVDPSGNILTLSESKLPASDFDFLTTKFNGLNGTINWQQRLNGAQDSGIDTPAALAIGNNGDVAVTGTTDRGAGNAYYTMTTVRYNRFALSKGDLVHLGGNRFGTVSSFSNPLILPNGTIVARIVVLEKGKLLQAVMTNQDGNRVLLLQGETAPGVTNGRFSSIGQPAFGSTRVIVPVTLSGVPADQASTLWAVEPSTGNVQLLMQTGTQAPGLGMGVQVASVTSFSPYSAASIAQVTLKGTGVTTANNTALLSFINPTSGVLLVRKGQDYTLDGKASTITAISVFTPAPGSNGHGRYIGSGMVSCKLTLADKRVFWATVDITSGNITPVASNGGDASSVAAGAQWLNIGLPGVNRYGANKTTLAQLTVGKGGVTSTDDSVIVMGTGAQLMAVAREGSTLTAIPNTKFASFGTPVSGGSLIAFKATITGTGVNTSNNSGLWFAWNGGRANFARTGNAAPNALGSASPQVFAGFSSIAQPENHTALFIATLRGPGVTTANNRALFAFTTEGLVRRLLRTGDKMGTLTVKSFSIFTPAAKSTGVERNYTPKGDLVLTVTFTNGTSSILRINMP